jgi:transposase
MKTPELTITNERIDDFVVLLTVLQRLGLPAILDRYLPRHGLQQGLSWGWLGTIWLAHILSEGDHRKLTVRDWVRQAHTVLERVTGLDIRETDFTDDRLTLLLHHLSKPEAWHAIEAALSQNTVRVYDLQPKRVRIDATTVSGYHKNSEDGLFQFGHSKDNPALRQIKVMMGTVDPLGMPLVTDVVAGQHADDPLYIPVVDRVVEMLDVLGLLFVGDCKMSALATRAHIHRRGQHYLCPLPMSGNHAELLATGVQTALEDAGALQAVYRETADGERVLIAEGYEMARTLVSEGEEPVAEWIERVIVARSETYRDQLQRGLEQRLTRATEKLLALTPEPGPGKRQIRVEAELVARAEAILQAHDVVGLLSYTFERQEKRETRYVGRGRGGADRPTREMITVRYQITSVSRETAALDALQATLGWRMYVTNAPPTALSLEETVLVYRDEWVIERNFHRLKGAPLSLDPLFVKRDDQIAGLTHLLSLGVRLLTLMEFVVRRKLQQGQEKLVGLHAENPKKGTDRPTTERLLRAFHNITFSIVQLSDQVTYHVTPLTPLQTRILELLDLSPAIYTGLATNWTK